MKARWNTPTIKNNIVSEFKLHGIAETSLVFLPAVNDYNDHLEQYNLVDIALDTFPYGGTTTTCEALMMGVPVVTLVGKLHAQRVSYSILKNIGFTKTITFSEEEYINTAVKLASHPDVLDSLRTDLPLLLQRSITGQPRKFTRQLEELYLDACLRKGIDISELNNTGVLKTAILTMNNDISIVVPHTLEEPVTYIITEQSDWYEEEICFLREIVKPGMQILDLQAEYGCYALSMAKQIGSTGAILAHDGNKYKCHCLRQSAKLNGFTWLSVTTSDNESVQLQRFLQDGVDFIIAGETNAIVQNILLSIAENCSPLIMARALLDTGLDNSLSNWMDKYDYMPFRLIPSLKILVPLPKDFTPTSWHRQVFFCRPDRAKVLSSKGYLAQREIESIEIPDDLTYWEKSIRSCNYANKLLPIWEQQAQKQLMTAEWETLRNALSAYAVAHDCSITAELRYGCLAATMSLLLNTEELQSSTARLCTVARIATEIRNYPIAIQAAEMVAANIRIDQEFIPNEPFLPMSSSYDQENYQNSLTEWIFAQSIAQIELLKNPTSFWINDSELLKTSDIVQNIGFMNDKLLCRESLIRNRKRINNAEYARGTQNVLENRVLYNPCADQHTRKRRALSLMVFDRLSPDMWRMLRAYFIKAEAKKYENLILAIPSGEDQEKIDLYLKDMCMFEISIDLPVQIITGNSYENQKQFLYDLLQQSNLLHVPKTSSTKVQDMVLEIATELEIQVVWDDEKPYFMPNHLPPIKDFQVTIMLTTYNRVDLLKRAVESILKQTYNDFILVIHDDASTDGTEEYCTNLAQNNTKIRYRRNPTNLGPGVNGADMTCVDTELVMGFTDDDFMLDSAALEKMVDAFHQHPHIGMAFGQCLLGDVHTKKPRSIIPQNYTTNCILDPEQMLLDSIAGNNIYGVGHVFRKSMGGKLIQEYISKLWGKSNIGLEGDYIVGLVECMVAPIAYVHIPSIYYSIWPETISSSQLGGGWSMHIRLRAVALLDNIYHNHFGRTRSENRRIKLMVDIFKQQFKCMQNSMTSEELIERKDELNCYAELIECIKKHKLPNSLLNTTLL